MDAGSRYQLVDYRLEAFATEMARACIAEAGRHPGFDEIVAAVDDLNAASRRVFEKLGFDTIGAFDGASGASSLYRWRPVPR